MYKIILLILILVNYNSYSQVEDDWDKEYWGSENSFLDKGDKAFQSRKFFEAIQYFNKSIEINDKNFSAYFLRGISKSVLEDSRGAVIDLDKAEEILILDKTANGKSKDDYNLHLGNIYSAKGATQIKLKNINSGCYYLSKAGELGIEKVYTLIKQYCR